MYGTSSNQIESTVTIWGTDPLNDEQQYRLEIFVDVNGTNRIYTDTTALVKSKVSSSSKVLK